MYLAAITGAGAAGGWLAAHPVEVQNALVTLVVLGLGGCFWRMSQREFWRQAFRELMGRKLVGMSFAVLSLYVGIALLDSIMFYGHDLDNEGRVRLNEEGVPIVSTMGRSVLSHVLLPLQHPYERTYSAPLADRTFTPQTWKDAQGNAMLNEKGKVKREPLPLLSPGKHVLGTDKVGADCLYLGLKGIRTGIIIGGMTTLIVIPFALLFGIFAGYFGGWIDDVVQFVITVLSSIPSILLIMSFMLVFGQGLPQLCFAMAIQSWTGLCRVLRAETMKIREMDYVQSGRAMGVGNWWIMMRHILPNVMHLVLITSILGFSGRVMSEAVLTYIGVGIGSQTISWGSMLSGSIGELSREPVIWWKLLTAFLFMFGLVLPANIFGDAVRDALDPKLRKQ
jgi:ABC-type dipeptide/oligopeptide/nickel transport system permease subunit